MRLPGLAVPFLSLLLLGCNVETGNEAQNAEASDASETAPAPPGTQPPDSSPPQQPGKNALAPEGSGEVALGAAPASTTEGATVTLTLSNGSQQQIGYNLCTSDLETSAGRRVPTNRVCTMELRTLEPGRSADYRYALPVNMSEGSYRFSTQVHWMDSGRRSTVSSNSFKVRPDG